MNGQWTGDYSGSNNGLMILNIDDRDSHFEGIAYLNEQNSKHPSIAAYVRTIGKLNKLMWVVDGLNPINPYNGLPDTWDNIKKYYPNTFFPTAAQLTGQLNNNHLKLSWVTDIGTFGNCILNKSKASEVSKVKALKKNWGGFKQYVANLEGRRFLFRGQNKPWKLRTSFHRTGRADLQRFLNDDIQTLHKHLSARTKHIFNLDQPSENGAFFNLVQHHGYPTPLLDWTYSPYVAAFFAYRGISNETSITTKPNQKVRIYVFDQVLWKNDFNQIYNLSPAGPHLSISEFIAIENERMIPQQAVSTVSNIDDIEAYILSKQNSEKQYLWAIDLPVSERKKVVQELGFMGLTAGSLFPGLDGACEELRERNF